MMPGLDPKKGMLALLAKYPNVTDDICALINRQQRDAKAIAEALHETPFSASQVTADDLKQVIEEQGPPGLLSYFELFHEHNKAILDRVLQVVPGSLERLKAASRARADAGTHEPATQALNCPSCGEAFVPVVNAGVGPCPSECGAELEVGEDAGGLFVKVADEGGEEE